MNRPCIYGLCLASLALAGCAGTQSMTQTSPAPGPVVTVTDRTDTAYVGAVEAVARQRGVRVVWVHPPLKRVETVASNH